PARGARPPRDRRTRAADPAAHQCAATADPVLDAERGRAAPLVRAPHAGGRFGGGRRREQPAPRPARTGTDRAAGGLRRARSPSAARRGLAAGALAFAASARVVAAVAAGGAVRVRAGGGAVLALRSVGTGRPAVAALGGVRRPPARAARGLRGRGAAGRRARRLVVAALALRRDRQAASAGSAAVAARPLAGHGHAVAGHRRRLVAAAA